MSAAVTTAGSSARATAVEPVTSTTSAPFSWSEDEPAPSNAATGTTNLGGPRRSLPGSQGGQVLLRRQRGRRGPAGRVAMGVLQRPGRPRTRTCADRLLPPRAARGRIGGVPAHPPGSCGDRGKADVTGERLRSEIAPLHRETGGRDGVTHLR